MRCHHAQVCHQAAGGVAGVVIVGGRHAHHHRHGAGVQRKEGGQRCSQDGVGGGAVWGWRLGWGRGGHYRYWCAGDGHGAVGIHHHCKGAAAAAGVSGSGGIGGSSSDSCSGKLGGSRHICGGVILVCSCNTCREVVSSSGKGVTSGSSEVVSGSEADIVSSSGDAGEVHCCSGDEVGSVCGSKTSCNRTGSGRSSVTSRRHGKVSGVKRSRSGSSEVGGVTGVDIFSGVDCYSVVSSSKTSRTSSKTIVSSTSTNTTSKPSRSMTEQHQHHHYHHQQ